MRIATANAISLRGELFYLAPSHVFFAKINKLNQPRVNHDLDFDIDDSENEGDDGKDATVPSIASRSPDDWSESNTTPSDHLVHTNYSSPLFDAPETPNVTAVSPPLQQTTDGCPPSRSQVKYPSREVIEPPWTSLDLLGVLIDWSVDQDWALVKVFDSRLVNTLSVFREMYQDLSAAQIALLPHDGAKILTYTASGGQMTGTIAAMPSYTRIPGGTSFQEVFSVNLDGPLTDGDCGSVVFDAMSGELYGHIIAGCRTTGFAYVMAAGHAFPQLQKFVRRTKNNEEDFAAIKTSFPRNPYAFREMKHENDRSPFSTAQPNDPEIISFQLRVPSNPSDESISTTSTTGSTPPPRSGTNYTKDLSPFTGIIRSLEDSKYPSLSDYMDLMPIAAKMDYRVNVTGLDGTEEKREPTPKTWSQNIGNEESNITTLSPMLKSLNPSTLRHENGLLFITGKSPADFRTKAQMDRVRTQAMSSYLQKEKNPFASSSHNQERSDRDTLTSKLVHTDLESQPMVLPIRTGVMLPYDTISPPPFQSIGKPLDPFRSKFQASHPRISVEELKRHFTRQFRTRAMDEFWIPTLVKSPGAFLSTLCIASAHYDAINGRPVQSVQSLALRQETMHLISQSLLRPDTRTDDSNIIALTQLIASEMIFEEETALIFHQTGVEAMIKQRGGLDRLGVNKRLASTISWLSLESAIFHESKSQLIYSEFCASDQSLSTRYPRGAKIPESPIFCPRGKMETVFRSQACSSRMIELLMDIRMAVDLFLHETNSSRLNSLSLKNIYKKLLTYPSTADLKKTEILARTDWKYEAIRIASIIQGAAIMRRIPLSEALNHAVQTEPLAFAPTPTFSGRSESLTSHIVVSNDFLLSRPSRNPSFATSSSRFGSSTSPTPSTTSDSSFLSATTITQPPSMTSGSPFLSAITITQPPSSPEDLLRNLKITIENTDLSDCWSDMAGVLLWIGLIARAASRKSDKVLKNWFAALTVRVSMVLSFEHPEAINATVLRMTEVVEALSNAGNAVIGREPSSPSRPLEKGKARETLDVSSPNHIRQNESLKLLSKPLRNMQEGPPEKRQKTTASPRSMVSAHYHSISNVNIQRGDNFIAEHPKEIASPGS